jgi:hypothetical protein
VLVVVVAVGGVAMAVVHEIDVIAVRDGRMPAAVRMGVLVGLRGRVHASEVTLVVVVTVAVMGVPIVQVVDVVAVAHGRVPALEAVLVVVAGVRAMLGRSSHVNHSPRNRATRTGGTGCAGRSKHMVTSRVLHMSREIDTPSGAAPPVPETGK